MKQFYIVYKTTNIVNNKIYIGVHGTNTPDVFDGYIGDGCFVNSPSSYRNPKTPYQRAVKKYGPDKFNRKVLKCFDRAEDAYDLERFLVDRDFLRRKDTYNACLGGYGGSACTVHIFQFTIAGVLIQKWNSISEAASYYNVSTAAMNGALVNKGTCAGFYWSYDDSVDITRHRNPRMGTTCYQYNSNTKLLMRSFSSVTEAANITGIHIACIQKSLLGGYKAKDSYFSYELVDTFQIPKSSQAATIPLYIYDLQGTYVATLITKEEKLNFFNIHHLSNINAALRIGRPFKQWQISTEQKEKLPAVISKTNIGKSVGKYTVTGDLVETYKSITQAKKINGAGCAAALYQNKLYRGYKYCFLVNDIVETS